MSSLKYQGPVVLVVMDGVGLAEDNPYNAVTRAHAETLHELMAKYPMAKLGAAGHYVGIPDGDMGNSEVGHNAMGAGEIVLQRSAAVEEAMNGGAYETQTWKDIVARVAGTEKTLHFMGIFSDGNVHSHIAHLEKMMAQAQKDGIEHIRVHILLVISPCIWRICRFCCVGHHFPNMNTCPMIQYLQTVHNHVDTCFRLFYHLTGICHMY